MISMSLLPNIDMSVRHELQYMYLQYERYGSKKYIISLVPSPFRIKGLVHTVPGEPQKKLR